jgi:hypothetical protein
MEVFEKMKVVSEEELKILKEKRTGEGQINLIFRFLASPEEIVPNGARIGSINFSRNRLFGYPYRQLAEKDSESPGFTEEADILFTCIGYKSIPIRGEPFDKKNSLIPNINGCILTEPDSDYYKVGKYAVGWVKSGATGVIDSTLKGAEETFNNMVLHLNHNKLTLRPDPEIEVKRKISSLTDAKSDLVTTFGDWLRINEEEIKSGSKEGRCRVKLNSYDQIRDFLHK